MISITQGLCGKLELLSLAVVLFTSNHGGARGALLGIGDVKVMDLAAG